MRTPTTPRRSWETIAFVLKAIAITALALEPTRSAAAQCQTWALEPQFDSSVVGGDEIDTCTVFNDGSGAKLWVGGFFGT